MNFSIFWIDWFYSDRLFGFGLFSFDTENAPRSLLAIYWNDRELLVDLFWVRILTHVILVGYKEPE